MTWSLHNIIPHYHRPCSIPEIHYQAYTAVIHTTESSDSIASSPRWTAHHQDHLQLQVHKLFWNIQRLVRHCNTTDYENQSQQRPGTETVQLPYMAAVKWQLTKLSLYHDMMAISSLAASVLQLFILHRNQDWLMCLALCFLRRYTVFKYPLW